MDPRASIFAAVKAVAPNVWGDLSNIAAMDDLLDRFGVPRAGQATPAARTSAAGIKLIHEFESCRLTAYPDPGTGGKPWTIGWGSTTDEVGKAIVPGTVWTQERADKRFALDLERFERGVIKAIGNAPTTQAQFDAMVSFHYNTGKIAEATLTKKHIAGDFAGAKAEFAKWVNAGGRPMKGLIRRRAAEAALYAS